MEDDSYITDIHPPSPQEQDRPELYPHSYNNSPYSSHSDLSYDHTDIPNLSSLFPGDPVTAYNPADYDNPASSSSLLMFSDEDYYTFDSYRSPSPSSDNDATHSRSRASSTSSNPTFLHSSPTLNVTSFENMSFQSPNWGTAPLPKPHSPPRLVIDQPPIIIAPEPEESNGPRLQLVPATPVSGGDNTAQESRNNWLRDKSNPSTRSPSPAPTPPAPSRSPSSSPQPYPSNSPSPVPAPFLFPQHPRSRSKSDTALEPPNWDTMGGYLNAQQQLSQPPVPTGGLNSNFTFGQPPSSTTNINTDSNGFLSPDLNASFTPLRRSKSDAGGRGPIAHHRASRSEDISAYDPNGALSGAQQFLFPPSSHEEFLRQQQQQFLSPNMSGGRGGMRVPELSHQHSQSLSGSTVGQVIPGHYRRASSGTRSERGTSWDRGDTSGGGRASPYFTTPNASPRMKHNELRSGGDEFDSMGAPLVVSKPNVTTGRTANASHKRRKQEATFVCPIPGCGSTFTRSFNLKGHIRSHNEEKPFQCHWPGCGKGFARQHDCKRHEQLHTNYRPFTCEGCNKQFARMDALNRHLRSEGGADCVKLHEASLAGGGGTSADPTLSHVVPSSVPRTANNPSTSSSSSTSASRSSSSPLMGGTTLNLSGNVGGGAGAAGIGRYDVGMGMMGMMGGTKMEDGWPAGLSVAL